MSSAPHMRTHAGETATFHFVRHGATEPNLHKVRCGGDLDVPLTDLGREQARATGQRIRELDIAVGMILCSPLARTRLTAAIIGEVIGVDYIVVEPLLNERALGQWNLMPIAETEPLMARNVTPPGGESEKEFVTRIAAGLERIAPFMALKPLVVGSKGVARVLNSLLGGAGRLTVDNGAIVEFNVQPAPAALERLAS